VDASVHGVGDVTDDEAVRLRAAVKSSDGFFTTFFVSSYTPHLVRAAARLRIRPNQVTSASLVVGLAAAAAFGVGSRAALVTGAVALQVSFALDVVDGQLARYTNLSSALGAWFDSMADRMKEYAVYVGLAVGSIRGFNRDVWALAGAALALQTCRHMFDLCFGAAGGLDSATDVGASSPVARLGRGAIRLSERTGQGPRYWAKRVLVLPIGERLFAISITAAVFDPHVTFLVLLVWGGVALAYATAGRVLRSAALDARSTATALYAACRDDGPLGEVLRTARIRLSAPVMVVIAVLPWFVVLAVTGSDGPALGIALALVWLLGWGLASGRAASPGPLDWSVPPLVQAAEYAGVLRLAALASDHDVAAGYALACVVALRHYDLLYRPASAPVSRVAERLAGGWGLRLVVAGVLAAAAVVEPGYYLVAGGLAVLFAVDALVSWHDRSPDAPAASVAEETR
jgi:phosphatidylglycerophosphate synthase